MAQQCGPSGLRGIKILACFLASFVCLAFPALVEASPCTPGSFRVRLNDCPVQKVTPQDGETVEFQYIPIVVQFPLLYVDGDASKTPVWQHENGAEDLDVQANLIQGGTVRFQTKTFKSPGIEASIPCPTIYWPKGANVKVLLKNNLDRDVNDDSYRLNIHTHGLHIGPDEDDSGIIIRPTEQHLYDYHLPRNHGGGTHWYHPHINTLSELVVGGGTAGMMVVADAEDGTEVPDFVLAMPEQVLVIQFIWPQRIMAISRGEVEGIFSPHRRKYVRDDLYTLEATDESNNPVNVPDTAFYYLVNGLMQPVISFVRNQWTRLRLLHTSNGHDVRLHVEGAECKMYLLAKDGVYLPQGPRDEFGRNDDGQQNIRLTASTRADIAIRCTGLTPGGATPFVVAEHHKFESNLLHKVPIMVIELLEPTQDPIDPENPVLSTNTDDFSIFTYTPCHPAYLPDLLADNVVINGDQPFVLAVTPFSINGKRWGGFAPNPAAANLTVMPLNTVQEWELKFAHHPFHMHINHFMLAETVDAWDQVGDWVDTVQGLNDRIKFRFITDRYAGRVTMHCHNLDHADEGSMAMAFITNDPRDPVLEREVEWEEDCNVPVSFTCNGHCGGSGSMKSTSAPSPTPTKLQINDPTVKAPTTKPSATPSKGPTHTPTSAPSVTPSKEPTKVPSNTPSKLPTSGPTYTPSKLPTSGPTYTPSNTPTYTPTSAPTYTPTELPTTTPTKTPTRSPSLTPTTNPTKRPTMTPTQLPTHSPSVSPSMQPSVIPTKVPTKKPTILPSVQPSVSPTLFPTSTPTIHLLLRGDLIMSGYASSFTPKMKTALEKALTEELEAWSVDVFNVHDVGANRLRRLMDSASEQSAITMNMPRRALQDGGALPKQAPAQFVAQFTATYKSVEAGVYGKKRIQMDSAAAILSVKQRIETDLGSTSSTLEISSLAVDGVSPTRAPTESPRVHDSAPLIGGVAGGVALLVIAGMIFLYRRRGSQGISKGKGKGKDQPQEEGLEGDSVFARQLAEARRVEQMKRDTEISRSQKQEEALDWGAMNEAGVISEQDKGAYSASSLPLPSSIKPVQDSRKYAQSDHHASKTELEQRRRNQSTVSKQ